MKGSINLKNKDHKCFVSCHVRLINPQINLNYSDNVFPLDINDYEKI